MTEDAFGSVEATDEFSAGKIPMGRLGQPEEIARAVVFPGIRRLLVHDGAEPDSGRRPTPRR